MLVVADAGGADAVVVVTPSTAGAPGRPACSTTTGLAVSEVDAGGSEGASRFEHAVVASSSAIESGIVTVVEE